MFMNAIQGLEIFRGLGRGRISYGEGVAVTLKSFS